MQRSHSVGMVMGWSGMGQSGMVNSYSLCNIDFLGISWEFWEYIL